MRPVSFGNQLSYQQIWKWLDGFLHTRTVGDKLELGHCCSGIPFMARGTLRESWANQIQALLVQQYFQTRICYTALLRK